MDSDALPMLKPTYPLFGTAVLVQIGGHGQVTEIEDPSGQIRRLLELLDGSRTVQQVWTALRQDYPLSSVEDVQAAIRQLDEAGFLLDGSHTPAGILDDYELSRWARNINFFGSYSSMRQNKYELQGRLRDARITLLGLGGLGSHLLLDMAAMGVGHVRAIEFDRVEISNLNRQILYRDGDIGQEKLRLATERVRDFNPRIEIEPVSMRIGSAEDVASVADGADLLICVADRPKMEIMHWVNAGCVQAGVPFLNGGLDTQRAIYYTVIPGTTGCVECWRLGVFNSDPTSAALLQQKRDLQIGGNNAAFTPLVTMTTGFMLGELTRLITGIAPPVAAGRLMQLRFYDYEVSEAERWDRLPECTVCGQRDDALNGQPLVGATAS
ncbi:MAG TPA: ThiF family adenylyltransferase [Jatrophihabitans sp.]